MIKIIVCIAKDEPNIQEWIDYHFKIGFDGIVIYCNDWKFQSDDLRIVCRDWPGDKQQMPAYNHALCNHMFDWAAFIDCDEYIVCPEGLDNFLTDFNCSVAIPWKMIGNREMPGDTIVERFKYWGYDPKGHVKTFYREYNEIPTFTNPHYVNSQMVDQHGKPHSGPFSKAIINRIWINHYYYQDQKHWDNKIKRGRADTGTKRTESWTDGNKFNIFKS